MNDFHVSWNVFDSVAIWIGGRHVVNVQTDVDSAKSIAEGLAKLEEPQRTEMAHMIRDVLWKEVNPRATNTLKEKHNDYISTSAVSIREHPQATTQ